MLLRIIDGLHMEMERRNVKKAVSHHGNFIHKPKAPPVRRLALGHGQRVAHLKIIRDIGHDSIAARMLGVKHTFVGRSE